MPTVPPHDVASQLLEPAGTSPFHVKGVTYLGHLDYCERYLPGGKAAFIAACPDAIRSFFQQKFLPGNWYDVFPLAAAGFVCADLMGVGFLEFVRKRATVQAETDARGVYRIFFNLVSPRLVASKMPKLFSLYFNFGTIRVSLSEATCVEVIRGQIPAVLVPWQNAALQGFLEVVLPMAGAREVHVTFGDLQFLETRGPYEIVDMPTILRWS